MFKRFKQWFLSHIDYKITGEYWDTVEDPKYGTKLVRKYNKKYYWKRK